MPRIAFARTDEPETQYLVRRIIAERGELLDLYKVLLNSAPLADGWLHLLTAVRQQCTVPADLRELIIMRIASLNGASYEAEQHHQLALASGVSPEQLAALDHWATRPDLFSEKVSSALSLTDRMTVDVQVSADDWAAASTHWDQRELLEIVVTIASYNMVSRVLEALEIGSQTSGDSEARPKSP